MNRKERQSILVTGGAGFIGSNFIQYLFNKTPFSGKIVNFDCLTYAGRRENLKQVEEKYLNSRYFFEKHSINNTKELQRAVDKHQIDTIVHFAAESHVDRSIHGPKEFIETNILGTFNLLEVAREQFAKNPDFLFYHISTDEVYGSLGPTGKFNETTAYDPRSPYSASKAAGDHLVRASFHTYQLPILISNCSNNYGPFQHIEKLIPLMITKLLNQEPLPVYGDGKNIRDWLFVEDHCEAIWLILNRGTLGETYNVGGDCELTNLELVHRLCEQVAEVTEKSAKNYKELIQFVKDRAGHDRRYAIDFQKLTNQFQWHPKHSIETGLKKTVEWYFDAKNWQHLAKAKDYQNWLNKNYAERQ